MTQEEDRPHSVTFEMNQNHLRRPSNSSQLRRRRPRMKDVTKMVMKMNSRRNLFDEAASQGTDEGSHRSGVSSVSGGHRRLYSANAVPYQGPTNETSTLGNTTIPLFEETKDATTALLDHAQHLENLFSMGPSDSYSDLPGYRVSSHHQRVASIPELENESDEENVMEWRRENTPNPNGADLEQGPQEQPPAAQETTGLLPTQTRPKRAQFTCCRGVKRLLPPNYSFWKVVCDFFSTTVLLFMVPCIVGAWVFYYPLANPDLEFLPSQARLSWFLLFAVRQSVTFTLAQISQWVLQLLIRVPKFVKLIGPLVALVSMQSLGWPFLIGAWGIWNLILLHGDSPFIKHWFYWTGIKLFSIQYNRGDGILQSDLYGRILASMIVVGVAASAKRTFVALYLSRRMLQFYKAQLTDVMSQVKLIMEVAELASQTDRPEFEEMLKENFSQIAASKTKKKMVETVPTFDKNKRVTKKGSGPKEKRTGHDDDDDDDDNDDDDDSVAEAEQQLDQALEESMPAESVDPKVLWNNLKERAMNDRDTFNFAGHDTDTKPRPGMHKGPGHQRSNFSSINSHVSMVFPFLERWHEPKDKGKKKVSANLDEILEFKRAMAFMEDPFCFGIPYGSCVNRKACVKNAVRLYRKLLKYTPEQKMLSFDVIGALAYEDDGEIDDDEAIALLRLFFPDKDNMLPMLAFVQACDTVYKHMRFLRASISNSTKIDAVLEDTFDAVFYVLLVIAVLSLCGFNPWPLLVSLSTLMVSFAFAFGPSVAKNIEGILMIAVRRPYDIGDRITFAGAETVANTNVKESWLVEDITLSTTTLRYASTNEVATINNSSVAGSRIVNMARSSKAMVTIRRKFDVDCSQRQLDDFRHAMESYLENRPQKWISLVHYRAEAIDTDFGYVEFMYRAQHVKPWQELGAILIDKGDWERHADVTGTEMGILYETPARQLNVGVGLSTESQQNKVTADRKEVAEFLRSISSLPVQKEGSKDTVFGVISEYLDAGQPTAAATVEALQGSTGSDGNGGT